MTTTITTEQILKDIELICKGWETAASILPEDPMALGIKNSAQLLRQNANLWRKEAGLPIEDQS